MGSAGSKREHRWRIDVTAGQWCEAGNGCSGGALRELGWRGGVRTVGIDVFGNENDSKRGAGAGAGVAGAGAGAGAAGAGAGAGGGGAGGGGGAC